MKRRGVGDIAALFQKHEAKKKKIVEEEHGTQEAPVVDEVEPEPSPVSVDDEAQAQEESQSTPEDDEQAPEDDDLVHCDGYHLEADPGLRRPIASYPVNDQDVVRRAYILKGRWNRCTHKFPYRMVYKKQRQFSFVWLYNYNWLEYSVAKDAGFCFVCYLFGNPSSNFVKNGWRNWNKAAALNKHVGGVGSAHNKAQEKFNLFVEGKPIDSVVVKVSDDNKARYKARLTYSLRCLRFLLKQGLPFRGHDESEESSNRGNFLELLKWLAENNKEVDKLVLNNAPGNCLLTSATIQKDIIECCAVETTRHIIEELGDDCYAILADECSDVSHKEQLALCLRYVDKIGRVCERFLGVVHVSSTTSLSLKAAIESLLSDHHLSLTQIRGQGYDGASNMKGEINGLKTLIMRESPSAYYIHCFAHQLQLVLVAVAKENDDCIWFFDQVSHVLNIIGSSCKRHDMLRDVRALKIMEALELGEIESGSGLNQEMGLARPGDTRWGSHFKTILHIIDMYPTIHEVLITLGKDPTQRNDWPKIHAVVGAFESFDFVFSAHLMLVILGYTNELSQSLQKRDQDIVNAMSLVSLAKETMQRMRSNGWEKFYEETVIPFCTEHNIKVPNKDDKHVSFGRSARFYPNQTNDDHFRREVYLGVIDKISQELNNRFDEVNMELLACMSAFNPSNSFASYDAQKILRLAKFYPNDFSSSDLRRLEFQVDNFIDDLRKDARFEGLKTLGELSVRLVETNKHVLFDLVYLLLKLVLILPVATASVERVFSAMSLVKTKLRNSICDDLLNHCLVTYIELDIFCGLSEEDIINIFMAKCNRRIW